MTNDDAVRDAVLPCPFCGGAAQVWFDDNADQRRFHRWVAGCRHQLPPCDIEPGTWGAFKSKEDAVFAWNVRALKGTTEQTMDGRQEMGRNSPGAKNTADTYRDASPASPSSTPQWDGFIRFDSDCTVNGQAIKAGSSWGPFEKSKNISAAPLTQPTQNAEVTPDMIAAGHEKYPGSVATIYLAMRPLEPEFRRLERIATLTTKALSYPANDPNHGKSGAGKWTTINVRSEVIDELRAEISRLKGAK